MKNFILLLIMVVFSLNTNAQTEQPSYWEIPDNSHKMTLNYNTLGKHYAQGLFYGATGYGAGMWLSGNRTGWGVVGSVLAANIPILFENKFDEPETVIGRNAGALTVGLSFTFGIEMSRRGRLNYTLPTIFQKR